MSNADFWQICGIAALERGNSALQLTFKGCREDCSTTPTTDIHDNFPSATFSGEEMFAWFEEELDMGPEEVSFYIDFQIGINFICLMKLPLRHMHDTICFSPL